MAQHFSNCRRFVITTVSIFAFAAFLMAEAVAAGGDYVLHPGDQVAVAVYGDQTLSQTVLVLSDGSIVYPLIGKVKVGGYTIDAATSRLTSALRRYVRNPMVTLDVTQQGGDNVLVLGNVKTPGKYALSSTARIADAIAAAGGLGDTNGDFPNARISVDDGPAQTVSLESLLQEGHLENNLPLGSNSIVYVTGPAPMNVEVLGSVDRPGTIPVYVGDRLSIAIAKAGNSSNSQADLSHIHVTRTLADGATQAQTYDLYRALQAGDLSADPVLQKNDVVFVPHSYQGDKSSNVFQGILTVLSRIIFPF